VALLENDKITFGEESQVGRTVNNRNQKYVFKQVDKFKNFDGSIVTDPEVRKAEKELLAINATGGLPTVKDGDKTVLGESKVIEYLNVFDRNNEIKEGQYKAEDK
jgi:hypothetical protein